MITSCLPTPTIDAPDPAAGTRRSCGGSASPTKLPPFRPEYKHRACSHSNRFQCILYSDLLSLPGDPRHASSCDPVMALETQYVFNREVWLDLGNHPTEALAAQGARSPCSQIRGRWSRSGGVIGVTSTLFYSISFSSSSIANWVHYYPGDFSGRFVSRHSFAFADALVFAQSGHCGCKSKHL